MVLRVEQSSDRRPKHSRWFWLGLLVGGLAGIAILGQMNLFADDESAPDDVAISAPSLSRRSANRILSVGLTTATPESSEEKAWAPIKEAQRLITLAKEKYEQVSDYTCEFHKRERINGRLSHPHQMVMKARTRPRSLYFKFSYPNKGREAIFIHGKNDGRILAHDVGLGKLLGGTMWLDPQGMLAMADNRHPITDAGIGHLIETVHERWHSELSPDVSVITIDQESTVEGYSCTMVDSTHPVRRDDFMFYKVRVFYDKDTTLPICFEAYDWPKGQETETDLLEQYTYSNLRIDVGLSDRDFDTKNPDYSFGRF